MTPSDAAPSGATAVITHRVRAGREADYEHWLGEIVPRCQAFPGHLDAQIIRPIAGLTTTYTVVIRFNTGDHLGQWLGSSERGHLIEKVRPMLTGDEDYTVRSGLDFWFMPSGSDVKVPVRWKQFLIAWSAIYPLVLVLPLVVVPVLRRFGVPDNRALIMLLVTAVVVFLMTYVIMPRYTRLVRRWLFN
jgi:uncharacterized protein